MLESQWDFVQLFTGIIEETGRVITGGSRLTIAAGKVLAGLARGGSIAVNGACLTVTDFDAMSFSIEVMPETLRRTNLGALRSGSIVNLERPLRLGSEVGGHLVQGHVDGTGRLVAVSPEGLALLLQFEAPPEVMRYVVPKGFIAVDGVSLTVVKSETSSFSVSVVGFTREHTNLSGREVNDIINLEADITGKYIERFTRPGETGVTLELLKEHGFLVS